MPRGGKRTGAGRPKGKSHLVPTDQKQDLGRQARAFGDLALGALADIAKNGRSESARVAAATALLDRGYGKPVPQAENVEPEDTLSAFIRELSASGKAAGPIATDGEGT